MNCRVLITVCLLAVTGTVQGQVVCPASTIINGVRAFAFPDGSIAMRTGLAVNPDGTASSYTVGDHGFTYIANGLALWRNSSRQECKNRFGECTQAFLRAEAQGFGPGTAEFCVFAMEVEPPSGEERTQCQHGSVVGNGKGKPRIGGALETVNGETREYYASTTALMHTVNGQVRSLDSAIIPSVVIPTSAASGLGQVVWVRALRYPANEIFAVAGDTGPAFGEGSIALHQLLRHGKLIAQKVGLIPKESRCREAERNLSAPFQSRPDIKGDTCSSGRPPRGASDIRAYVGIDGGVDFVLLGAARFERSGNVVKQPLDAAVIRQKSEASGYTPEKIGAMAACLALSLPLSPPSNLRVLGN